MNAFQILDTLEATTRADRTDGQLLDLFVRLRDEDAFAAVVRRHGPMVLGVCRRVLRNSTDADDAFQAAFLVLARRAASITARHQLAQWLYGVAYNTARKLRQSNKRRRNRERPLDRTLEPHADPPEDRAELLAILDEELNQLPERYRSVVVLCDLEGRTRREAAQALSCPEGTVAGRLARARDMLAARLTARGVASAAGTLALVLSERTAGGIEPAAVVQMVWAMNVDGLARAAARGLISPRVAATTEGVLKSMFATGLRTVAAVVLCCGLALAAAAGAMHFANAQPTPWKLTNPAPGTGSKPAAAKPPEQIDPADAGKKVLTVYPLKKLDPDATAKVLTTAYRDQDVTVVALPTDKALLIYATPELTSEIELLLLRLGEREPKRAIVVRLKPGLKAEDVAQKLSRAHPDITFVPVPAEGTVLAYGERSTLKVLRPFPEEVVSGIHPVPAHAGAEQKRFPFRFKNAPWSDVFDEYSKLSGLMRLATDLPNGTFTLEPPAGKEFTSGEIVDLMNEALAAQKLILIRRRLLFVVCPIGRIDEAFVPRVTLGELAQLGKTELVEVPIELQTMNAATGKALLRTLLTPLGTVWSVNENRLVIRDTVGNIHRIVEFLERFEAPEPTSKDRDSKKYSIRFEKIPWAEVFVWYAKATGLTRVGEGLPEGTFSFAPAQPKQQLTLTELSDVLNDALLARKWLLISGEKTFTVVPADEKVDPKLIPLIPVEDMAKRGRTELVRIQLQLTFLVAPDFVGSVRKLLGPFGSAEALPIGNTLVISDTVQNLRTIVPTIRNIERATEDGRPEKK